MSIHIKNATVYDPVNKIDGEVMDVLVENGRIVTKLDTTPQIIDAKGKVLMSGGVDIHTHIAGPAINAGRLLRPEDKTIFLESKNGLHSGSGFSMPSTFMTGYAYALMGYSFLVEPAVPPIKAKHTHDELSDTPLVDKAALLLLGNNYLVAKNIADGNHDKLRDYVAWMLATTKTYGIKLVSPGAYLSWLWGKNKTKPKDAIPKFDITPSDIIAGLEDAAIKLKLPHPIHVHLNGMGYYGNYVSSLDEMKLPKERMHIAHLQYNSYGGDSWKNFESKADEIIKEVNKNAKLTFDVGQVTLDNTTTLTADSPFEQYLSQLTHQKWSSRDVELENGSGIVPYPYSGKNSVNAVQWAIGLELVLMAKDLSKVCLSTDHPNAGPFIRYPRIISWLMSKKVREKFANGLNESVLKRSSINSINRELTLYEIATITRSAPARILGIKYDGIKPGADANIAIYTPDDDKEKMFSAAEYVIFNGEVVVKNKNVVRSINGKTLHASMETKNPELERELQTFFRRYYSVGISNYVVS